MQTNVTPKFNEKIQQLHTVFDVDILWFSVETESRHLSSSHCLQHFHCHHLLQLSASATLPSFFSLFHHPSSPRTACKQLHTTKQQLLSVPLLYHGMGQIIQSAVVCLCMCLSLWRRLRSHFSTNLHKIWQGPLGSKKEEMIRLASKSENEFPYFEPKKPKIYCRDRQFQDKY